MNRRELIVKTTMMAAISSLQDFTSFSNQLPRNDTDMPVLFIGHGSPMNGIENNEFSATWKQLGAEIPEPKAVLCISAHWLTKGTKITAMPNPRTIHDFGGFPDELFQVQYPAPGNPELAKNTVDSVKTATVEPDHEWGLDHGCWTVVRHIYPNANIPVLQLSIDYSKPAQYHYNLAKELASLRKKGILIIGSGNMVHNLRMIAWEQLNTPNYGFDWAREINETFKKHILTKNHSALINYQQLGKAAELAVPTPDHYFPLLYALALQSEKDRVSLFNDKCVGGSLTMTSVKIARE